MIIEYFYPKHLKQAIYDLKAARNYRHGPVFLHELGFWLGCVFFLFPIYIFIYAELILIGCCLLILLVIGLIRSVKPRAKYLTAYALGQLQHGIVESVKFKGPSNVSARTEIIIIRSSDQKKLVVPDLADEGVAWMNISKGSDIMFFYTDSYPCYPMPNFEKFRIRYSIRKDLIPEGYR